MKIHEINDSISYKMQEFNWQGWAGKSKFLKIYINLIKAFKEIKKKKLIHKN